MTTFSPSTVGSVATRMSSMRPTADVDSVMRPSCGLRRSAMSSLASTLRRVVTPGAIFFGIRCTSRRTPSTRNRTTSASSCASKWTSDAFSSAAWKMSAFTSRTSGPSEMPSSASRSSPSSCSSAASSKSTATTEPMASAVRMSRCSSATMSSRDATPSSRECFVARRSSSIACRFPGSATATLRTSSSSCVRDGDRALERLHRDQLSGVDGDADGRRGRRREVVPHREHPRDPVGRRDAFVDERLRDRRAARCALAHDAPALGCDERRRLEEIEQELGRLVDAERRRERPRGRGRCLRRRDGSSASRCACELHRGSLERVIGSWPEPGLTRRRARRAPRYASRIASPKKSADDRAEREERDERHAHLPRRRRRAANEDSGGHERREEPDHEGDRHRRAEHGAEEERELHVAHPEALRDTRGRRGREHPTRSSAHTSHSRLGSSAVCATSATPAAGRTMRFGTIRSFASITERTTSTAQKPAASAASARQRRRPRSTPRRGAP